MPEPLRPIPVPLRQPEGGDRLDSWKEIAAYLGREVRTVQGWEKNEGLPVHRHQHARQGSVYASRSELDAWREARKTIQESLAADPSLPGSPSRRRLKIWLIAAGAVEVLLALFLFWNHRAAKPAGEPLSSVVVLPFLDLSPQKDQEYFSDGLTEEIIDALSRVPNLRVVARTTAFAFKGKANDIRQIGRQLSVGAVLEGSVRKAGDQLRITAQLNRVSDGYHLWSRTYDRQLRDVFAVEREIGQSIADQLRAGQLPHREATADLAAWDLYQEGRFFFNKHEPPDSYRKAIEHYQQAIARDPQFALAYAGMADAYAYLAENMAVAPREVMPKAKEAAEKAVELDDNLAEAHTSRGIVKLDYEWDRDGAQRELRRAVELNPGSGYVHHWYAHSLEAQGRLAEAMPEMRAALALDPLSLIIQWDIGGELISAKRYDAALRHLEKANEMFPNYPILAYMRAKADYAKGDVQAAHAVLEAMKTSNPGIAKEPVFLAFFGVQAANEGRPNEARRILEQLEQLRRTQYVEPLMLLDLCAALGDRKQLRIWFQRGYEERSTFWVYLPMMWKDVYAGDAELEALVARTQ